MTAKLTGFFLIKRLFSENNILKEEFSRALTHFPEKKLMAFPLSHLFIGEWSAYLPWSSCTNFDE
jgi:hypothetical protein